MTDHELIQKRTPKAKAARDAKKVGTKRVVASDVGLGAGASAAATFSMLDKATITTTNIATESFIFIDSISKCLKEEDEVANFRMKGGSFVRAERLVNIGIVRTMVGSGGLYIQAHKEYNLHKVQLSCQRQLPK